MRNPLIHALRSAALVALAVSTPAFAASPTGSIHGAADPNAQIVLIAVDTGAVIGVVATADGSYRAGDLAPGRYRIAEKGNYHAPREVAVVAGKAAEVDLAPASSK